LPGAITAGQGPAADLTTWQYWWHFNKAPFLRLKERLYSAGPPTTGSELFLGYGKSQIAPVDLRPNEADLRDRIRPALARALEEASSDAIVSSALIALARIGDEPGGAGRGLSPLAQLFREHLAAPSQEVQETAALALGILANERNVFLLAKLLEDDLDALRKLGVDLRGSVPQRTRAFACYALGLIGCEASVPARAEIVRILAERLEAEGREAARSDLAVACITSLGIVALPWRADAQPAQRKAKQGARIDLRTRQDQIAWLLELCDDKALPEVASAHLPVALGRLLADVEDAGELRVRAVARLARDLAPLERVGAQRRCAAALGLGLIVDGDEDPSDVVARRALATAVSEVEDRNARCFALLSLAQAATRPGWGEGEPLAGLHGPEGARAFLLGQLAQRRSGLAPWAALGLGVMEYNLRELGHSESVDVRSALLDLLGGARAAEEVGALSIAAGLCGGPESARALRATLERSSDPDSQVHVAVALGLAGQYEDLDVLLELARASTFRPALMESAAVGAGLLGGRGVSLELVKLLEASTGLATQASLCRGLGFIGDRRSIDVLVALLDDRERPEMARSFAAVALGLVADKQDLPWGSAIAVQANYRADVPTFWEPYGSAGVLNLF
jgi:HEAT repeat protein